MNFIKIQDKTELLSYMQKFEEKGHHVIALDIEAESNLHAYGERLCLVQIFDGVDCVLIDPFKISSRNLKVLFENKNVLKVMYDAGSDSSLLKNAANIELHSVLDLRVAVELLDYSKKDLHSVVSAELGIVLENKRKYQKYNWTKRPLSEDALQYAMDDVLHLLILKDLIMAKLYARKLLEPFLLKNLQIQTKNYTRDPEDKYRKMPGYSRLDEEKKDTFRKVFDVREKFAKLHNVPPHNLIHKGDVINIVDDPLYIDQIRFTRKLRGEMVQAIISELKSAVKISVTQA